MDANDREKLGGGMICDILKKQGHMFILKPASFTIEFSTIWFVVGAKRIWLQYNRKLQSEFSFAFPFV